MRYPNKLELNIPADSFVAKAISAGHTVVNHTILFGKDYVWMKDLDGTLYLERIEFSEG